MKNKYSDKSVEKIKIGISPKIFTFLFPENRAVHDTINEKYCTAQLIVNIRR